MARLSLEERLNRIEDKISEKSFRENKGRISKINKEMAQEIQMFLVTDLSEYLWGKCE